MKPRLIIFILLLSFLLTSCNWHVNLSPIIVSGHQIYPNGWQSDYFELGGTVIYSNFQCTFPQGCYDVIPQGRP